MARFAFTARLFVIGLASSLFTACSGSPMTAAPTAVPCSTQSEAFVTAVKLLAREWEDASTLANNTPRASLSPQIESLQAIRRKVEALDVPTCAAPARDHLVNGMQAGIDGFLAFQRQDIQDRVNAHFAIGTGEIEAFTTSLTQLDMPGGLPPATLYTDGLKIDQKTVIAAFPKHPFKARTVNGLPGMTGSTTSTVEMYGPEENLIYVSYVGDPKYSDQVRSDMETMLKTVLPDWSGRSTWLDTALKATTPSTVAINGRVVSYDPTIAQILTVRVPEN